MSNCLFCRIAAGEIPARTVHDDSDFVAFEDINPQAPTHVLIIPRRHVGGINDLTAGDRDMVGGAFALARQIASARGLSESGYRVVVNSGPDGGQTVFHLHFHLLGGRAMTWPPG